MDLHGINFSYANLEGANLENSKLGGTNIDGANLWKANLKGTVYKNAVLFKWSSNLIGGRDSLVGKGPGNATYGWHNLSSAVTFHSPSFTIFFKRPGSRNSYDYVSKFLDVIPGALYEFKPATCKSYMPYGSGYNNFNSGICAGEETCPTGYKLSEDLCYKLSRP